METQEKRLKWLEKKAQELEERIQFCRNPKEIRSLFEEIIKIEQEIDSIHS